MISADVVRFKKFILEPGGAVFVASPASLGLSWQFFPVKLVSKTIRIGTRKSQLALWQAEYVRGLLLALVPDRNVELVKMTTEGDRILDRTLASAGGKGLFTKELEVALLEGRADLAVHSMKDVTVTLPDELHIAAICEREDPRDAFVSSRYATLTDLPAKARVGTASLRRQSQLRDRFPHLDVIDLRGNVNTRLARLDAGDFDAIILAAAGLKRLGFSERIRAYIPVEDSLPAVGQGAVGIECRRNDVEINGLVRALNHASTATCVLAERALNHRLAGGCQVPIGGYATLENAQLHLRGLVGAPDGSRILRAQASGDAGAPEALGERVARALLEQGAQSILDRVYGGA